MKRHMPQYTGGKTSKEWERNIWIGLKKSHLFELQNDVKKLLVMTTTPKENEKVFMPFDKIFIDTHFTKEELKKLGVDIDFDEVTGVLVQRGTIYRKPGGKVDIDEDGTMRIDKDSEKEEVKPSSVFSEIKPKKYSDDFDEKVNKPKPIGKDLRITVYGKDKTVGAGIFETYAVQADINKNLQSLFENLPDIKTEGEHKKTKNFVHRFTLNFLNFINNPEVEYVSADYGKKKNLKRVKKGKFPIPPRSTIKLSGKLKKYTQELKENPQSWNYGHRFWVRGHFRVLRDEDRYGGNVGRKIWIPPYVKGQGILIKKKYKIEKDKEEDE